MHGPPHAAYLQRAAYTDVLGQRRLRCGETFDVLRVPEPAGRWALRRLIGYGQPALLPGPVALERPEADAAQVGGGIGRHEGTVRGVDGGAGEACLFFVAPGAAEDLPELLDWLDWGGIDLGLRAYGEGESVREPAVWLNEPSAAAPEVVALLATIAECCSRRLLRSSVPSARRTADLAADAVLGEAT